MALSVDENFSNYLGDFSSVKKAGFLLQADVCSLRAKYLDHFGPGSLSL